MLGTTPEGLAERGDLPPPEPLPLTVWRRQGLATEVSAHAAASLRRLLTVRTAQGA